MEDYNVNVPVVLIMFNRPECVKACFESIRTVQPHKLYIIADGPRIGNEKDIELCAECMKIVSNIDWECEVIRLYADTNLGCGLRPATGLSEVFAREDCAIILEDDCVPSPDFFIFCELLLKRYENDDRVCSIGGMSFGLDTDDGADYFFSYINHTWGWATWKRVWKKYDYRLSDFPKQFDRNFLKDTFDSYAVREYFYKAFGRVYSGEISSAWDYQFLFSSLAEKGLHIYPTKNLVRYIGFDESATHTKTVDNESRLCSVIDNTELLKLPLRHPQIVGLNKENNEALIEAEFQIKGKKGLFDRSLGEQFEGIRNAGRILIYGAGEWGMRLGIGLMECGVTNFEYLVTVPDNKRTALGKRITPLEKYERTDQDLILIAVSGKHRKEVIEKLNNCGIQHYVVMKSDNEVWAEKYMVKELDPRKILLITTVEFAGHGKQIVKKLKELRKDLDIGWYVNKSNTDHDMGVKIVSAENIEEYSDYLYTAKYVLTDTGFASRRKGQIKIQMKHWSSITLKMFGYDELRYRGEEDPDKFGVHGWDNIDYLLVGSEFDERTCRTGFQYNGPAIHVGSPRSDILFDQEYDYSEVRNRYLLDQRKKYVLYAPTFRIKEKGSAEDVFVNELDFSGLKNSLDQRFGGDWQILLRLHPFVAKLSKSICKPEYVVDVSDYYDGEELVGVADALITDYSSIMFEPAYIHKPVFLFAPDKEKYLAEERGFYIEYDELPFAVAQTNEELCKNIMKFNQEEYDKELRDFYDQYGVHEDGKAAERAAMFIISLLS